MHRFETIDGNIDYVLEGNANINYNEIRFIDADVQNLVDSKLIMERVTSQGYIYYDITGEAIKFIELLK